MEPIQLPRTADAWGPNVIAFVPPPAQTARLSWRDRMDVAAWREPAQRLGYDRLTIHEHSLFDPPELESFLSVYRDGARWARWSLARRGAWVFAWCSTTGVDVGRFASMSEALRALLGTV